MDIRRSLARAFGAILSAVLIAWNPGCGVGQRAPDSAAAVRCDDPYLRHLLGEWSIERMIRGEIVGNSMDVSPILGGSFVRIHMQSTTVGKPYEAVVIVGRDSSTGEYVAHWCDSFGAEYSAQGRGRLDNNTLEFVFHYPSGPFFNTWTFDPVNDQWTFVGESGSPDGSRKLFARDRVTRAKGR